MCAIELRFAISADDQHAFVTQLTEKMAQQPERAAIGPVQVVCVEEQRLALCDCREDLHDGVEEEQAFFVWR